VAIGLGTLLAAIGLSQFSADLLDKAGELLFGTRGRGILEQIQDRLRAYTGKVPVNHDIEQAIRYAELTASIILVDHYRRTTEGEHFDTRSAVPPPFIGAAQTWLHQQIGLCASLKVVPNDRIVGEINSALDLALSAAQGALVLTI
jgi:hypothetical protein